MNIVHTTASGSRTKTPRSVFTVPSQSSKWSRSAANPRAPLAAVALGHEINANIVHRWIRVRGQPNQVT